MILSIVMNKWQSYPCGCFSEGFDIKQKSCCNEMNKQTNVTSAIDAILINLNHMTIKPNFSNDRFMTVHSVMFSFFTNESHYPGYIISLIIIYYFYHSESLKCDVCDCTHLFSIIYKLIQ